ncbi:hypothetical protein [Corynebacterium flavescens]|uniref:hypothetical protein n=1 Tax=Corynebacterium flavescens TaxID=28028 RepID=UPI003FD19B96
MKFFSRKALVAGATAIAVSFAGVNVASAAEAPTLSSGLSSDSVFSGIFNSSKPATSKEDAENLADDQGKETESASSNPEDIKAWIGIITAVVGALSAIYSFVNKISK